MQDGSLRDALYDDIRRKIIPGSEALPEISPRDFGLDENDVAQMDAYYSAIGDLEAEQYVTNIDQVTQAVFRPERSDRSKSFFEDHRSRGHAPTERLFGDGLSVVPGTLIANRYRDFTSVKADATYTMFERVQEVNGETRAFTVSAFPFGMDVFASLIKDGQVVRDVFDVLRENGHYPTERRDRFWVRYPFRSERVHLKLETAPRVPALVALGENRKQGEIVELYLNVMRADRYELSIATIIQ